MYRINAYDVKFARERHADAVAALRTNNTPEARAAAQEAGEEYAKIEGKFQRQLKEQRTCKM